MSFLLLTFFGHIIFLSSPFFFFFDKSFLSFFLFFFDIFFPLLIPAAIRRLEFVVIACHDIRSFFSSASSQNRDFYFIQSGSHAPCRHHMF